MNETCPHCGSRRIRHEIERDDHGIVTADYWTCEECLHGWAYQSQRYYPSADAGD